MKKISITLVLLLSGLILNASDQPRESRKAREVRVVEDRTVKVRPVRKVESRTVEARKVRPARVVPCEPDIGHRI